MSSRIHYITLHTSLSGTAEIVYDSTPDVEESSVDQPQNKRVMLEEDPDSTLPPETSTLASSSKPASKRIRLDPVEETSNMDIVVENIESPTSTLSANEEIVAKKTRRMATCAVADCPPNPPGPMHRFPDSTNPANKHRISEWTAFCKRKDKQFNPDTARICSLHFSDNQLKPGLVRKILKADAFPDRNPPKNVSSAVKHHKASSRFNVQLQPKKRIPTANISAPPPTDTIAESIVEPILESVLESIVEPKVWMDSGITTFEQRRSYEMEKMKTELQSPDVKTKPLKSRAKSDKIVPSPSTSSKKR